MKKQQGLAHSVLSNAYIQLRLQQQPQPLQQQQLQPQQLQQPQQPPLLVSQVTYTSHISNMIIILSYMFQQITHVPPRKEVVSLQMGRAML